MEAHGIFDCVDYRHGATGMCVWLKKLSANFEQKK
jgi:hypothetical protein